MMKESQYKLFAFISTSALVILCLVLMIMYSQGYRFTKQKNYLYIDLKQIYSRMQDDYKPSNITDKDLAIALSNQKSRLQRELKLLEEENIVFISHKPLSGAKDYTEIFYKKLIEKEPK